MDHHFRDMPLAIDTFKKMQFLKYWLQALLGLRIDLFWPYIFAIILSFSVISCKIWLHNDLITPRYEVTFRISICLIVHCIFVSIFIFIFEKLTKLSSNCLKPARIIIYSCYNTRNSNHAVAATPEIATTQLLQHQKQQLRSCYSQQQQLSKAGYFATAGNNNRQLSEEHWHGTICSYLKRVEHNYHCLNQEHHGETAKECEDPKKTVKDSYQLCNSQNLRKNMLLYCCNSGL